MRSGGKQKILAIRTSALGDVAMTLPVLYSVARKYPDTDFYLLTRPFFSRLLINPPENLHTITADFKKEYHGWRGLLRLIRRLRSMHFDCVADLHDVLRSRVITAALRLPYARVDKDRRGRKELLKNHTPQKSYIDRYCDVFEKLGLPVECNFTSLFEDTPTDPSRPTGPSDFPIEVKHPAVGIAPFARYVTKQYPLHLMKLVVEMTVNYGINVYLFGGGEKEKAILNKWTDEYNRCTSLAGRFTIEQELAIMSQMDLMVAMDSANQHLASLAGTRAITIWGSTVPYGGFLGYRQSPDDALCAGIECQPCSVAGCERCKVDDTLLPCMNSILLTDIVGKIRDICLPTASQS